MRGFVVSGDKFEIRQFKNALWKKQTGFEKLPQELREIDGLRKNIEKNGVWYFSDYNDCTIFAFFANIGNEEHPLVEKACISTWYFSNSGGVYLTGRDKKTGAFFAPVVN